MILMTEIRTKNCLYEFKIVFQTENKQNPNFIQIFFVKTRKTIDS